MGIHETSDSTLSDFILSPKPALVLFGATWSGHSALMLQVFNAIAEQYGEGEFQLCYADVDKCQKMVAKFGIGTIPATVLFSRGSIQSIRTGYIPHEDVVSLIGDYEKRK